MPPRKLVLSLTQMSINSLTKLLVQGLDPHFLLKLKNNYGDNSNINSNLDVIKEVPKHLETQNAGNECTEEDSSIMKTTISDLKVEEEIRGRLDTIESIENTSEFNLVGSINHVHGPKEDCTATTGQQINLLKNVQEFLMCLAQDLTSHAHCTLQELLFWSVLAPLNHLYTKHRCQEMRKLIKDIVPLFINASLRIFDFGSFKMFTEASMFQTIYTRLKEANGLEKLVFGRSCYWRSRSILNLSKVLKGMTNLQILHIHYICQSDMLQLLPNSCPQLRELSLKGSKDITDKDVPLLVNFVNLDTLDISGTSITGRGCRSLVLGLPLLLWLTHCPFNCNSDTLIFESRAVLFNYIKDQLHRQPVIISQRSNNRTTSNTERADSTNSRRGTSTENKKIDSKTGGGEGANSQETFTLKLKNFWLFNTTTEELFLTQLCPQLEHLRLDFVMQDLPEAPEMEAVRHLSHLCSLALYTYDRCPIQLVTNVIESTSCLTTLHLHLGDEWFFVAPIVNVICQYCHNLAYFTMEGDYKGQHSLEESDSRLDFSLPPEGLCHLKEATIAGCVSDARLMHLLTQAPNLHTLHLDGELEWLHDDTFTDAIKQNLLLELKVLWFNVSAGITFSSVRRLLQSTNNLQRVGRLCLMSSASKEAYHNLLCLIKKLNIATELIWVTDQRELRQETRDQPPE